MSSSLRILHFETDAAANEAVQAALSALAHEGVAAEVLQVSSRVALDEAIAEAGTALLIPTTVGDETLAELLDVCRYHEPEIPCIVLSDQPDEESALAWLKQGFTDVVAKTQLGRLAFTVERAVRESRDREAMRLRETELREMVQRMGGESGGTGGGSLERDALTGLLSWQGMSRALERELELAHRTGSSLLACLVSCNDLDKIEQNFGRECTDLVLQGIASRLSDTLRRTQILGRVGESEFLALFPCTRRAEGYHVAARLRATADSPVLTPEAPLKVEISEGVVPLPWDTENLEMVLELARAALEEQEEFRSQASSTGHTLRLGGQLLHYDSDLRAVGQPIVNLADESVVGYELLCRGPAHGLFEDPERILDVARAQSKLPMADLYCLKACLQEARNLAPGLRVHVNIRPSTLFEVPFRVIELLLRSCRGVKLFLELSEEQFIGHPWGLVKRVQALKKAGVRLVLDDVGRGRGTLDTVMLLEPQAVKIGAELITGASEDVRKQRLLRRILLLADSAGCDIIAEGIETSTDAALARSMNISLAQGFLWSQPVMLR